MLRCVVGAVRAASVALSAKSVTCLRTLLPLFLAATLTAFSAAPLAAQSAVPSSAVTLPTIHVVTTKPKPPKRAQRSPKAPVNAPPRPTTVVQNAPVAAPAQPGGSPLSPPPPSVAARPAGQPITTVGNDRFKASPVFTIGDMLQDSPGISIKQGNGPRDVGISIRGSNANNGFGVRNIVVLEDGFPVTQPDGLSRTDITDPHEYKSIDVYRGPSSALFGNYAIGGAINFHTRTGADINGFEYGSEGGSFGYLNNYLTLGRQSGPFGYALFGSDVRGDGWIANSRFNTQTESMLASYHATPNDVFTYKFINNNVDTQLPIRLSLTQFQQNPFQRGCTVASGAAPGCATASLFVNGAAGTTVAQTAGQAGLGRDDRRTIGGVRWEHDFDKDTVWRTQAVFDDKNINQPTGATSAIGDSPAINVMSDLTRHGTLLGLETTHFVQLFYNDQVLNNSTYNVAPGGDAALGQLSSEYSGGLHSNTGARAREEIKLDARWTALVGADAEYTTITAQDRNFSYTSGGTLRGITPVDVDRRFLNNAEEAGLLFRLNHDWQFRGRVATGYGTPQLSNLLINAQGVAGNNTQLQSQTNLGYDLGADWTPLDNLLFSITGFYEFFHNELVTQSPGAGLQNFTFNAPASEHRGVELAADWRPVPGWRVVGAYSYDNQIYTNFIEQLSAGAFTNTFNRAGNRIPGVSPNELLARLGYDQPIGPWRGLGGFVEFQWKDAYFMDNANLVQAPAYELVNLNAHYTTEIADDYLKGATFFFEVKNAFNKTYVASANNVADSISSTTGQQNPASVEATATGSIYAGAPRTFIAGMRLAFR